MYTYRDQSVSYHISSILGAPNLPYVRIPWCVTGFAREVVEDDGHLRLDDGLFLRI